MTEPQGTIPLCSALGAKGRVPPRPGGLVVIEERDGKQQILPVRHLRETDGVGVDGSLQISVLRPCRDGCSAVIVVPV